MYVSVDHMAFGRPLKYVPLEPLAHWDAGLSEADSLFNDRSHNLFVNNCHHHVCCALNNMDYPNGKWTQLKLVFLFLWRGKYVSVRRALVEVYVPFLLWMSVIALVIYLSVRDKG